jgi:pimeloyl-ACP methyl ester carboxylesterase
MAGEEDVLIPPSEGEFIAKQIPGAEFDLIPKAGHLLNLEQPQGFKDVFFTFLKRKVL